MAGYTGGDRAAVTIASAAAIAAAMALLRRPAAQASADTGGFPPEVISLLVAIAADNSASLAAQQELVKLLGNLNFSGAQIKGWPPARDSVQIVRILFAAAVTPVQLPDWAIPDGQTIQVIAWPTNANLIYVADSQAGSINPNQAVPLGPAGGIGYHIKNANVLWVSSLAAGDAVSVTCER